MKARRVLGAAFAIAAFAMPFAWSCAGTAVVADASRPSFREATLAFVDPFEGYVPPADPESPPVTPPEWTAGDDSPLSFLDAEGRASLETVSAASARVAIAGFPGTAFDIALQDEAVAIGRFELDAPPDSRWIDLSDPDGIADTSPAFEGLLISGDGFRDVAAVVEAREDIGGAWLSAEVAGLLIAFERFSLTMDGLALTQPVCAFAVPAPLEPAYDEGASGDDPSLGTGAEDGYYGFGGEDAGAYPYSGGRRMGFRRPSMALFTPESLRILPGWSLAPFGDEPMEAGLSISGCGFQATGARVSRDEAGEWEMRAALAAPETLEEGSGGAPLPFDSFVARSDGTLSWDGARPMRFGDASAIEIEFTARGVAPTGLAGYALVRTPSSVVALPPGASRLVTTSTGYSLQLESHGIPFSLDGWNARFSGGDGFGYAMSGDGLDVWPIGVGGAACSLDWGGRRVGVGVDFDTRGALTLRDGPCEYGWSGDELPSAIAYLGAACVSGEPSFVLEASLPSGEPIFALAALSPKGGYASYRSIEPAGSAADYPEFERCIEARYYDANGSEAIGAETASAMDGVFLVGFDAWRIRDDLAWEFQAYGMRFVASSPSFGAGGEISFTKAKVDIGAPLGSIGFAELRLSSDGSIELSEALPIERGGVVFRPRVIAISDGAFMVSGTAELDDTWPYDLRGARFRIADGYLSPDLCAFASKPLERSVALGPRDGATLATGTVSLELQGGRIAVVAAGAKVGPKGSALYAAELDGIRVFPDGLSFAKASLRKPFEAVEGQFSFALGSVAFASDYSLGFSGVVEVAAGAVWTSGKTRSFRVVSVFFDVKTGRLSQLVARVEGADEMLYPR